MWQIVIIMFMSLNHDGHDAITVEKYQDNPLVFETKEQCLKHMWENLEPLKQFGSANFNGAPVKEIGCWEKQIGT